MNDIQTLPVSMFDDQLRCTDCRLADVIARSTFGVFGVENKIRLAED